MEHQSRRGGFAGSAVGGGALLRACAIVAAICLQSIGLAGCAGSPESRAREVRGEIDRADIELALRRPKKAERRYHRALALSPGEPDALRGLARAQTALGRYMEAVRTYDALEQAHPGQQASLAHELCPTLARAAAAELGAERPYAALRLAQRHATSPCRSSSPDALLAAAQVAEGQRALGDGREAAAAELFESATRADARRADAFLEAARVRVAQGERGLALALLSEALLHHPDDHEIQALMIEVLGNRVEEQGVGADLPARPPAP